MRECIEGDFVQRGRRLWCNCPLHDEDTPSFALDSASGLWYCFGACGEGGDLIQFVQRRHQTSFWDSLEWLATRAGVELPRRQRGPKRDDPGLAILSAAERLYRDRLQGPEGNEARHYLQDRQISAGAIEAFGVGFAPAHGNPIVAWARSEACPAAAKKGRDGLDLFVSAGLVRRSEDGRPYDFFRGRLMIPIRDDRGRTVAFGARRLDPQGQAPAPGPKYINTPETPWFHKGRLIYGYDRAADTVRRGGHLILMEGYTDVIGAHQAGIKNAGAVLGTATTPDHARLVRKAGTRRVTLVFDGDEAGRKAAWKALEGLLPLQIDLDVAVPPKGSDPADLVAGGDPAPLLALIEQADDWLDFVVQSLGNLKGRGLSQGVDRILELFAVLPKPVHQEACLMQLAQATGMPLASLRMQRDDLPARRRAQARRANEGVGERARGLTPHGQRSQAAPGQGRPDRAGSGQSGSGLGAPGPGNAGVGFNRSAPLDRRVKKAYMGVLGAALCDTSLIPRLRPLLESCPLPSARVILQAMIQVWDSDDADLGDSGVLAQPETPAEAASTEWGGEADSRAGRRESGAHDAQAQGLGVITPQHIVNALGDHAVREHIATLIEYVQQADEPAELLEMELAFLTDHELRTEKNALKLRVQELQANATYAEPEASAAIESEVLRCLARMSELDRRSRSIQEERAANSARRASRLGEAQPKASPAPELAPGAEPNAFDPGSIPAPAGGGVDATDWTSDARGLEDVLAPGDSSPDVRSAFPWETPGSGATVSIGPSDGFEDSGGDPLGDPASPSTPQERDPDGDSTAGPTQDESSLGPQPGHPEYEPF